MNSPVAPRPDSDDEFELDDIDSDDEPMSKKMVHLLLMHEWKKCFQQNADFKAYCDAKRSGDAKTHSALEEKHARIAELYDDWGDIHATPSEADQDLGLGWLHTQGSLFSFPEVEKSGVLRWQRLQKADNAILVKIPKGLRKDQLLDVIADFVEENPDVLGDGPKYEISYLKGKQPEETLKYVRRASIAHLYLTDKKSAGGSTKDHAETVIRAIVSDPEVRSMLGLNWRIHGELNQQLFEQDKRSADEIKNYTRTLTNLNNFYADCIDGAIRGTFPSKMKT